MDRDLQQQAVNIHFLAAVVVLVLIMQKLVEGMVSMQVVNLVLLVRMMLIKEWVELTIHQIQTAVEMVEMECNILDVVKVVVEQVDIMDKERLRVDTHQITTIVDVVEQVVLAAAVAVEQVVIVLVLTTLVVVEE